LIHARPWPRDAAVIESPLELLRGLSIGDGRRPL
jgi:hypothetical protein